MNSLRTLIKRLWRIQRNVFSVDWIDTIRINAQLPFVQFIQLPIWVYNCKIESLSGKIEICSLSIHPGMIRLGLKTTGICGNKNEVNLKIQGSIQFMGPGYLGNYSSIEIAKKGSIKFGKNFGITSSFKICSRKHIEIGDNFSSLWEVSIFDTDFHTMINIETGELNESEQAVYIGNDVWCCQRVTILKGTYIPSRSIIASNSLVNADFKDIPANTIYAGIPAKPMKSGWTRQEFKQFETEPMTDITHFLQL